MQQENDVEPRSAVRQRITNTRPLGRAGPNWNPPPPELLLVIGGDMLIVLVAILVTPLLETPGSGSIAARAICLVSVCSMVVFALRNWNNASTVTVLIVQSAFLYWYVVPIAQTAFTGELALLNRQVHTSTDSELIHGVLAVFLAKLFFGIVYLITYRRRLPAVQRLFRLVARPVVIIPTGILLLELALGLLPFFLADKPFWVAILSSRSEGGIFPRYVKSDTGATLTYNLTFFLMSASLIGFDPTAKIRTLSRLVLFRVIGVIALATYAIAVGTRTALIAMVMPLLSVILLRKRTVVARIKIVMIFAIIWMIAAYIVDARTSGLLDTASSRVTQIGSGNLADNNFFGELIYSMQVIPSQHDFSYESPLLIVATGWIPRFIWPSKLDFTNEEYVMRLRIGQLSGELQGNILPGIIGQYWQVAGWFGICLLGIWLGLFCSYANTLFLGSPWCGRYFVLVIVWTVFIAFRGLATSLLFPPFLFLLTIWGLNPTLRRRRLRATSDEIVTRGVYTVPS